MEYPFDSKFKEIVDESEMGWDQLFARVPFSSNGYEHDELEKELQKSGYSREIVKSYLDSLREWTPAVLFERAIADFGEKSPALRLLQTSDSRETLERAFLGCRSNNPKERAVSLEVLMRTPGRAFKDEAVKVVEALSKTETESMVLEALGYAMAHLDIEERVQVLQRLTESPDAETRFSAAFSLGGLDEDRAINQLITLSSDADEEVRDWATFGLGSMTERDTPEIRQALVERLEDTHDECRHEAIAGLAQRHDGRVKPALLKALQSKCVWIMAINAAKELADPDLYESLMALKEDDEKEGEEELDEALKACRPVS